MKLLFAAICLLALAGVSQASFSKLAVRARMEKIVPKKIQGDATMLYMVNNSMEVGPGFSSKLLEYDTSTSKYRVVTDKLRGLDDSVSGSCLCGDNFYATITDAPISFGLVKVNIRTGKVDYLDCKNFLFHQIQCDPNGDNNTFIGAASQFTSPPTFSVQRYDATSQTTKAIGQFPHVEWAGWDSIFSFDFDNNALLAAFATIESGLPKGAKLYEMDLKTGSVSGPKAFDGNKPVQAIFASGKDQFIGSTVDADNNVVQLCQFDKSGSSVAVTNCNDAPGLHTFGLPYPICNNKLYTLTQPQPHAGAPQGLYVTDLSDLSMNKIAEVENVIPYAVS